jgi:hypothetical protein
MTRKNILRLSSAICLLFICAPGIGAQATNPSSQTPAGPRLDIYGFVMTDFGYDLRNNDPDWFDVNRPSKLQSFQDEFGFNGKTYAGVRQTRFGIKASEPTKYGELKTQFEFDMFGVGADAGQTTIRPRHFYAELGAFGAGQTNSPFMDIDVFPNILDYWGPNGMVFFRNVQVRWMPIRGDTQLTFAAERPGSSQDAGVLSNRDEIQNLIARFPAPDLSGQLRYGKKWGHIQASGIVRETKLDDLLKNDPLHLNDTVVGWGAALSSNLKWRDDVLRLQYVYGDGIENYMNDAPIDIALKPNFGDRLRPIRGRSLPMQSLVAYLDHSWSKQWSSSAGYSQLVVSNTVLQTPQEFHRGQYATANLLFTPMEHMMYGGEVQWARRTNFGDGFHANDYRIQFSFKFNWSAQIGGVK